MLLACTLVGAMVGGAVGIVIVSGQRCGGPVCAGLIVIPMLTALPGAAAGLIAGAVLWLRARQRERLTAALD